jgi:hypothetical protein
VVEKAVEVDGFLIEVFAEFVVSRKNRVAIYGPTTASSAATIRNLIRVQKHRNNIEEIAYRPPLSRHFETKRRPRERAWMRKR